MKGETTLCIRAAPQLPLLSNTATSIANGKKHAQCMGAHNFTLRRQYREFALVTQQNVLSYIHLKLHTHLLQHLQTTAETLLLRKCTAELRKCIKAYTRQTAGLHAGIQSSQHMQ